MTKPKPKRKNPQDITLRNLRAMKKLIELKMQKIDQHLTAITLDIADLFNRCDKLEKRKG